MSKAATFLIFFLIFSQNIIAQNPDSLKNLINDKYAIYSEGFKRQDAKMVANLYSTHGTRAYSNGKQVIGRMAIEKDISKFISKYGSIGVVIQIEDLWEVDDFVFETGVWEYKYKNANGSNISSDGTYFGIWRFEEGSLKLWQDFTLPFEKITNE